MRDNFTPMTGGGSLDNKDLQLIDAYWRAANYVSVGQIYLMDNPLLREPLRAEHVKPRLLGHWGTTPGLNFIYVHLNRIIKAHNLDMIYVTGPGHGGPALVANTYLEGSYTEHYPEITQDLEGLRKLFKQFSFPGGIPSHVAPETPGSLHEGGELGYSLSHAHGAAFDNPNLIVACVVGDGEAETGALAASWHSIKFVNAARDGAVLPILHLNGYKIASATILGRMRDEELIDLFTGFGYAPVFVSGSEPSAMHKQMARVLDAVVADIQAIQSTARNGPGDATPRWPLIILRSPKGWTGPASVDGKPVEGTFRAHQVPLAEVRTDPEHLGLLEDWMRGYRPDELFDAQGRLLPEIAAMAPTGDRRMGANPRTNGGLVLEDLSLPDFRGYAVDVPAPGAVDAGATVVVGQLIRDVFRLNAEAQNFRLFGPDETESNRLTAVFEATDRVFAGAILATDEHLAHDGRVMEVLSEHLCQGWLEGYLLTGRHGLFTSYEAFIHIVDSMFNQHAKWLRTIRRIAWRKPIASLNYLLTSHVWRQDHNGFSHQDPGFLDHVANKKAEVVRIYLPPDANTLLSVTDHCLRSRHYVNVIVAGKQPAPQWLDMDAAERHCRAGLGIWEWAGSPGYPDVVMACAGDVPTLETMAAVDLLRGHIPRLKIRVVNVVDLMALQSSEQHPHGLDDAAFDAAFTTDRPIVFAFHGYPALVHRLVYKRTNHASFHVHGYMEEGTTTTPFDMTVLNRLDRFHLAQAAIKHACDGSFLGDALVEWCDRKLAEHRTYVHEFGEDMPEVRDWRWNSPALL